MGCEAEVRNPAWPGQQSNSLDRYGANRVESGIRFGSGPFEGVLDTETLEGWVRWLLPAGGGRLAREEPVPTVATSMTIEVTDVATPLLGANSSRVRVEITNNEAGSDIYIGFNNLVTAGNVEDANGGQRLRQDGSTKEIRFRGAIWAICPAGGTAPAVNVQEFFE